MNRGRLGYVVIEHGGSRGGSRRGPRVCATFGVAATVELAAENKLVLERRVHALRRRETYTIAELVPVPDPSP